MASRSAQDKFDDLLKAHVAPVLQEAGFKRSGSTFRRRRTGAWQILNLQRSRWSDSRSAEFTINLGASLDVLHGSDPSWVKRGWPLEAQCDFRTRIGALLNGADKWWAVTRLRSVGSVAAPAINAIESAGIPWLDLHADPALLLDTMRTEPTGVDFFNLHAFARLAQTLGDAEADAAAEREIALWSEGARVNPRRPTGTVTDQST